MTQVNFYILPDDQLNSSQQYACNIAEKKWLSGLRVLIQTDSMEESQQLDDLLWELREDSFIPHGIATLEPSDSLQPILISHQKIMDNNFQSIINLSSRAADIEMSIDADNLKIDEVLNQNENRKISGRNNYKTYRSLNYTLEHHTLETING